MERMKAKKKPADLERLAFEIRSLLLKHHMWVDVYIYFNGKRLGTCDGNGHYGYNDPDKVFIKENVDPKNYFNYVGPYLSMSFEGDFYDVMNWGADRKVLDEFDKLVNSYGFYYELGNAWNLSLFAMDD